MADAATLGWEACAEVDADGVRCSGVQLITGDRCLAHAAEEDVVVELKRLGDGGVLDGRGVPITSQLLDRLLAAVPRNDNDRPVLNAARFDGATFLGWAGFEGATFQGRSWFDGATFQGAAGFEGATFHDEAGFDKATFHDWARFDGATFQSGAGFHWATFRGWAGFEGATFQGWAWFSEATFQGEARFSEARFQGEAWFDGASFQGWVTSLGARFDGATFHDEAKFDGATFQGAARFSGATFQGQAWFDGATFHDWARFDGATFHDEAKFERATFHDEGGFDGATFQGQARFGGATFRGEARFDGATFQGEAKFSGAIFGGWAGFEGATFRGKGGFGGATFRSEARFDGATFQGAAWFEGATFRGKGGFGGATFRSEARFDGATFQGAAWFDGVTFEQARQLGPMLVRKQLVLDLAVFKQRVQIAVGAAAVCGRRAQFPAGVHLRLRWASVVLDDADLGAPSILAGARPFPNVDEARFATTWARLPPPPREQRARPRLLSVRYANLGGLTVSNTDLRACRFLGAHNLDRLHIEGQPLLARARGRRRTGRLTLAEEHYWRHQTPRHRRGWSPPACRPPAWADPATSDWPGPAQLARLYRELRKGREDTKDEPGAADFYYGEMEMRRHAAPWWSAERLLLTLYWLVSGYALRAWRAFAALLLAVVVAAGVFATVGFKPPDSPRFLPTRVTSTGALVYREQQVQRPSVWRQAPAALGYSAEVATSLLRGPDRAVTTAGEWAQTVLRWLGPLLFGLALVSLRGRVKR
jgi:uncharacterized protein YjbI with pentapeptide repeats